MQEIHKYIFLVVISTSLLFSSNLVSAENIAAEPLQNARLRTMEGKENAKNAIEVQKERAEKIKEEVKQRAQKAQERIKEARKNAEEKAKDMREKAKQRISEIKDKKKQEMAQKIASQFERINKIWTDHFAKVLDRLDAVLQKIKSRTQKAGENGKDVSVVNTAIANAEAKITQARSAVALQAQKTYVLNVSTAAEATPTNQDTLVISLREQFKTLKEQLHKDLTALRDGAMKSAREAVKSAFEALSKIPGVDGDSAVN